MSRKRTYLIILGVWFSIAGGLIYLGLQVANSFVAVGSTLVAVGGSGAYYFYQEYVKRPEIKLIKDENGYEKFLLFGRDESSNIRYCYPLIQFHITVKNTGFSTAKDCFARLNIEGDGKPFGRWQALKEETIGLHPGLEASANFMRFIPKNDNLIRQLNEKYKERGTENRFDITKFAAINYGPLKDNIKYENLDIYTQVPRRKASEERLLSRYNLGEPDIFWGRNVNSKRKYKCSLEIGAEGYFKKFDRIEIDIEEGLDEGKWKPFIESGEGWGPMLDLLEEQGWSK